MTTSIKEEITAIRTKEAKLSKVLNFYTNLFNLSASIMTKVSEEKRALEASRHSLERQLLEVKVCPPTFPGRKISRRRRSPKNDPTIYELIKNMDKDSIAALLEVLK